MCGFAGIVHADGSSVDRETLAGMTQALSHRGPDDEGYAFPAEGVGLGHRRLKVIDLEGGAQPMADAETGNVLLYNGEVYNFEKLRSELGSVGYGFETRSDTEVVLKALGAWGDGALDRFNGMFALSLWDDSRRRLLLARDRMGQKPLYWFSTDGEFVFASELKALLKHPACPRTVSVEALQRYLVCEFVPAPYCILQGVYKLAPAACLTLDVASWNVTRKRYWSLPFGGDPLTDGAGAAEELAQRLERAVRRRLVSDVPLGVFLSGGIDSSTVAAMMTRSVPPAQVRTFAIGFKDPTFDESRHASRVATLLGTDHREEILEPSTLISMLPQVMDVVDEPLGDASVVPTCLLSRFARKHVTVTLGGDGGDELFAGYPTFQAERLAGWLYDWQPGILRRAARAAIGLLPVSTANISFDFKFKQFIKGADHRGIKRHQVWLGSFDEKETARLLHPDLAPKGPDPDAVFDEMQTTAAQEGPIDEMDTLLAFYARYYLAEDILTKVDRASMSVGLEVRAPFLDPEVVTLACRIPPDLRIRHVKTKYLLKKAVSGIVPADIVNRPKKGFGIPVARWLKGELRPLMERLLHPVRVGREGYFNPAEVTKLKSQHLAGVRDNRKQLWTLMVFQLWLERYLP